MWMELWFSNEGQLITQVCNLLPFYTLWTWCFKMPRVCTLNPQGSKARPVIWHQLGINMPMRDFEQHVSHHMHILRDNFVSKWQIQNWLSSASEYVLFLQHNRKLMVQFSSSFNSYIHETKLPSFPLKVVNRHWILLFFRFPIGL